MRIILNHSSMVPIYEQLMEQIIHIFLLLTAVELAEAIHRSGSLI